MSDSDSKKYETFEKGLTFLGWSGGSIHQVERALVKKIHPDKIEGIDVHERVMRMLLRLS